MSAATKKCHVCGWENAGADFFCQNCGIDISLVGDRATAAVPGQAPPPAPAPPVREPRVCPKCGHSNDAVFMLCANCGFDLASAESGGKRADRLFLLVGQETLECKDGDILGREGTVGRLYFSAIGTVSRRHARLANRNGCWFVSVLPGVQNITRLDGRELPQSVEHPLSGEHVLKLSTQCEVRLRVICSQA